MAEDRLLNKMSPVPQIPEKFQRLGAVSRSTVSIPEVCIRQGWNLHLKASQISAPIQLQK